MVGTRDGAGMRVEGIPIDEMSRVRGKVRAELRTQEANKGSVARIRCRGSELVQGTTRDARGSEGGAATQPLSHRGAIHCEHRLLFRAQMRRVGVSRRRPLDSLGGSVRVGWNGSLLVLKTTLRPLPGRPESARLPQRGKARLEQGVAAGNGTHRRRV